MRRGGTCMDARYVGTESPRERTRKTLRRLIVAAGAVHHFTLSGTTIFHSAPVSQTTSGWRFYHRDDHYLVHGTWVNHWIVVGSICNLHIDPTGCRTSGNQAFEAHLPNAKPLEKNSDGVWHFHRDDDYSLVSATWTDPAHMHGHVCDKGAYGCKPAYTFTFTAHAVG